MDSVNSEEAATDRARIPVVMRQMIARRDLMRVPAEQAAVAASLAQTVSLDRAAATALGRAAERLHRLPIFVQQAEFAAMSLSELPELLPERALLAVVEGPRDALGVMALCPGVLSSLIEMQALGRVTSRPPVPRRATRTDAAISADLVNAFLSELGRELAGRADMPGFGTFRYATFLDDPRALELMLEDGVMMRLTLKLRIGSGGQRDGTLMLAVPLAQKARPKPVPGPLLMAPGDDAAPAPPAAPPPDAARPHVPTLVDAVQQAPVRVIGVLCRRTLSLRALRDLVPGAIIPLPANVLDDARVETSSGQLIARGKLGEADGQHAIRLRALRATADPAQPASPPDASTAPPEPPMADMLQPDAFRRPGSPPPSARQHVSG